MGVLAVALCSDMKLLTFTCIIGNLITIHYFLFEPMSGLSLLSGVVISLVYTIIGCGIQKILDIGIVKGYLCFLSYPSSFCTHWLMGAQ